MNVLITGVAGFVGSHMVEFLAGAKPNGVHDAPQIFGTDRPLVNMENVRHLRNLFTFLPADITDPRAVDDVIKIAKPNLIFHLAAQSFVPQSWASPFETVQSNVQGEVCLFEAVLRSHLKPRIQIACSSEEYGLVHPEETPIRETNVLRPQSPYAVSKVAQDYLGYQYHVSYGLNIVRTRAFNHTGPRRGERFATSAFARQVARIKLGLQFPYIKVGNLSAERDFTDVRDVVLAYWMALMGGPRAGDVYNICSGTHRTMLSVLDLLIDLADLKEKAVTVTFSPDLSRPSDVPLLYGDYTKFNQATGWAPTIPFEQTMKDLLEYWVEREGSSK
jgi:GDP-4-dehydro-6-deoxy-D-mannose reductase